MAAAQGYRDSRARWRERSATKASASSKAIRQHYKERIQYPIWESPLARWNLRGRRIATSTTEARQPGGDATRAGDSPTTTASHLSQTQKKKDRLKTVLKNGPIGKDGYPQARKNRKQLCSHSSLQGRGKKTCGEHGI